MLLVAGVLAVFIEEALYKSNIISQQILNGEIIIGTSDIRKAIIETPGNIDPAILSLATYLFLAVWAWSIIDCYRLSKKTSTPSE